MKKTALVMGTSSRGHKALAGLALKKVLILRFLRTKIAVHILQDDGLLILMNSSRLQLISRRSTVEIVSMQLLLKYLRHGRSDGTALPRTSTVSGLPSTAPIMDSQKEIMPMSSPQVLLNIAAPQEVSRILAMVDRTK